MKKNLSSIITGYKLVCQFLLPTETIRHISYLASTETVRHLLLPVETVVHDSSLPAESVCMILFACGDRIRSL